MAKKTPDPSDAMPRRFTRRKDGPCLRAGLPPEAHFGFSYEAFRDPSRPGFWAFAEAGDGFSLVGFEEKSVYPGTTKQFLTCHALTPSSFCLMDRLFRAVERSAGTDIAHWIGHDGEWAEIFLATPKPVSLFAWSPGPAGAPGLFTDLMLQITRRSLESDGDEIDLTDRRPRFDDLIRRFEALRTD